MLTSNLCSRIPHLLAGTDLDYDGFDIRERNSAFGRSSDLREGNMSSEKWNYGFIGNFFVLMSSYWVVAIEGVAALLLGSAKFYKYTDGAYTTLFFIAACILIGTSVFDTAASFFRLRDEGWPKWLKILNVVAECLLAFFALLALFFTGLATTFSDDSEIKGALESAYILAVIKYSVKIIIKGAKAGYKSAKYNVDL